MKWFNFDDEHQEFDNRRFSLNLIDYQNANTIHSVDELETCLLPSNIGNISSYSNSTQIGSNSSLTTINTLATAAAVAGNQFKWKSMYKSQYHPQQQHQQQQQQNHHHHQQISGKCYLLKIKIFFFWFFNENFFFEL